MRDNLIGSKLRHLVYIAATVASLLLAAGARWKPK